MIKGLLKQLGLFFLNLVEKIILIVVIFAIIFAGIKHFAKSWLPTGKTLATEGPSLLSDSKWWEIWKKIPMLGRSPDKEEVESRATKAIVAKNLLVNGEFKSHWSKGWRKETQFDREATIQAVVKDGILSATLQCRFCGFSQPVAVDTLKNLFFEGRIKLKGNRSGGLGGLLSMAEVAVDIELFDGNSYLGRFWITNQRPSPLEQVPLKGFPRTVQNQKQVRVIPIDDQWQKIRVNLYQEALDHLGLDPNVVNGVVVSLIAKTSGQGAYAEAWVDYLRLYYKKEDSLSVGGNNF